MPRRPRHPSRSINFRTISAIYSRVGTGDWGLGRKKNSTYIRLVFIWNDYMWQDPGQF